MTFLAACVQMRSGIDRRANVAAASRLIEEAARRGAAFVSTPEMTNVLDRSAERLFAHLDVETSAPEVGEFAALARRLKIFLLIGSMAVRTEAKRAANRSFLFAPDGTLAARYDKIHRFDVDLPNGESWRESNVFDAGAEAIVAKTPLAAFGLTVCYDLRFPHLYRAMARAGADVLCAPAAFTKQTGEAHWHALLKARAIENGAFVIAAAQGGVHEDGRATFGHSLIIGPWGECLAEADSAEPGVILAEIDPARARDARARIPNLALENEIGVRVVGP
ncbi:MAG: carbon-nitrogen hydrolase family protein [Parvularculaceae bacterium]